MKKTKEHTEANARLGLGYKQKLVLGFNRIGIASHQPGEPDWLKSGGHPY